MNSSIISKSIFLLCCYCHIIYQIIAFTPAKPFANYKNSASTNANSNSSYMDIGSYPKPSLACLNTTNDVSWHGGYILSGTLNVYVTYITSKPGYYTSSSQSVTLIQSFITGLSMSPYAQLLTQFPQGLNTTVRGASKFNFAGNAYFNTPVTTLDDKTLATYLNQVIVTNKWPFDKKGLYIVVFSGDIKYSSATTGSNWNTGWCGFHMLTNVGGHNIQVLPVGDESLVVDSTMKTQAACAGIYLGQLGAGSWNYKWTGAIADCSSSYGCSFIPPNDMFIDSMISVISHEIFETVTDPNGRGWYRDCDGYEIGDMCLYDYGRVHSTSDYNYVNYNLQFGSNNFLVQEEWNYRPGNGSFCALSTGSATQNDPLLSMGQIAAIAFAVFLGFVLCLLICCYCRTHKGRPLKESGNLSKGHLNVHDTSTKTVAEHDGPVEQL